MMNNKVPGFIDKELKSDNDNPFDKCKLNRRESAEVLTQLITNYREGFVLALNSEWGTGKTTFLNMWQEYLARPEQGFQTIHFNAWKTDYSADPFIALISQLDIFNQTHASKAYQSFLKKGSKLITKVGPGLLKGIVQHYIGSEALSELMGASASIAADSLESQIDEQLKTEKSVDEFREALSQLVKEVSSNGKPLVFIIDELDRCRPNYAVAVLEYIKHFFAVKGIVFVLGIDKEQLGHAICGVYGSDNINADEYLRRFIDLEYSLPNPKLDNYCGFLYDYYNFEDFFNAETRLKNSNLNNERDDFLSFIKTFYSSGRMNLRQIEKTLFNAKIILSIINKGEYVHPGVLMYLLFLKIVNEKHFKNIINMDTSLKEVSDEYEKYFLNDKSNLDFLIWVEACLLLAYKQYFNSNTEKSRHLKLLNNDKKLTFQPKIIGSNLIDQGLEGKIVRITQVSGLNLHGVLSMLLKSIELHADLKVCSGTVKLATNLEVI